MVALSRHNLNSRTAVIQEAYIHGISNRSVDDLVKAMGMDPLLDLVPRLADHVFHLRRREPHPLQRFDHGPNHYTRSRLHRGT